jgi:DNA repair exonuclease SbcCD ATPase subunit/DNA repair exonuclease SbcCD nuclease subunit
MKYIIFSDIHLHNYSGGIDPATRLSKRLLIQKSILQQIIDLAIQEDATILFGGDLVHAVGNIPVEVLNVIHWFFEECKRLEVKIYAVQGNHDQIIRKNCPDSHSILSPFQNREQRNKDLALLKPTIRFVDYDQIEDVEEIKGFDIVIVHAQPDLMNKHKFHMEGVNWKKVTKNNRLVFFGHDHTRRELSKMCYVIGSPMQLTMNDVGEDRGCYIVDSEIWSVKFHKLDYPELKKLEKIESKEETKFEERIKATSFQDILVEWLDREQKPQSYLDLIQKDITDKTQVVKTFFNGKIQSIYIKDFLSIDEIKVELKNGFWLVMGENGTGKTTITGEGIYWILFDDTTKNLAKTEVVRNRPTQQKEAIGELSLVDDKQLYTIRRSSKNGLEVLTGNKNLVDGMTKIQAQDFLEKHILGFDKNTYLASCYFSQEQLLTLAQLGDADTTNLVTNLLGFETYDSLYVQMDLKKKEVTLQLELLEQSSVKLDNELWKNNEQQKNLKEQIECSLKTQCSLETEQSAVTIQIGELTTLLGNIEIPKVTTEEIDVSLLALNVHKTEMSNKQRTLQESGLNRTQDLRKELSILQKDLATIIQEQNKIDKEKTKIELTKKSIKEQMDKINTYLQDLATNHANENLCPTCGQHMPDKKYFEEVEKKSDEHNKLMIQYVPDTKELDELLNKFYDQEALNQELIENINKQILESDAEIKKELDANFAEIKYIEQQINDKQVDRNRVLKAIVEANSRKDSLTSQIKQLENRCLGIDKQRSEINLESKQLQLKDLEENNKKLLSQKDTIICDKNKLNESLSIYEFWHNSFSNKGIRVYLLDRFVNEFNSIVKTYCYRVSNGEFIVEFTPTSKIKSGLERNKLGLQVVYKDKMVNYAALSGGEKTRCNLPLCLGLNKWISKKHGLTNGIFGIMILDELFAHLDEKGRDNVAELLNEEGRNKSIFVIDHNDTLVSYTDNLWLLSKENDITKLQVV